MAKVKTNAIEVNDVDDELDIWIVDQETGRLKYVLQLHTNENGTIFIKHDAPEVQVRKVLNIPV